LGEVSTGGSDVGDVLILIALGIAGLTLAAFWVVRRWSRAARRRFVLRATLALGGVLVMVTGYTLADTDFTNALFSSVGAISSNSISTATEFTPSAVAAQSPSPGVVSLSWTAPQGGAWVRGYNIYRRGDGVAGLTTGVIQANVPACSGGTSTLCLVNGMAPLDRNVAQPYVDPDGSLSQVGVYYYVIRAVREGEAVGTLVEVPVNSIEVAVLPDPSTPGLLVTWPPANATAIPTNTTLAIQFDRPMSPLTVNPTYSLRPCLDGRTCASLGVAVPLLFEWTAQYTLLLVTPQTLLTPGTWHRVGIANGATDLGGNAATPVSWVFEVASGAMAIDATVPQVVGWDPPTGARDVRVDYPVTLLFSKPMNMTATNAAVQVCDAGTSSTSSTSGATPPAGGSAMSGCLATLTFRWDSSATLLTVGHPTAGFTPGKTYRVVVTTSARDAAGNQMPVPRYRWPDCPATMADCAFGSTFVVPSSALSIDSVAPPYLVSASPDAGARDVPFSPNATLVLQFSKAMARDSLKAALSVCPPAGTCAPDLSFGWEGDGKAVTVYFKDPLVAETTYQAVLTTRATDLSGTPLARAVAWSFTTGKDIDKVPPALVTVVPSDGQLGVALNAPIVLTFSEAVQWPTVRTGLSLCVVDEPTSCVGRTVVGAESGGKVVIIEHPLEAFRPGKAYRVRLGTSVRDLALNVLVAGGGTCPAGDGLCAWASTFTTVTTSDTTPPVIVSASPVDGAGTSSPAAPTTAPITLAFSEPMDRQSVEKAAWLKCTSTGCVLPSLVPIWGVANTQVSFTHLGAFTGGGSYQFGLTGEARDVAGNSLAGTCAPRLATTSSAARCDLDAFVTTFGVAATTGAPLVVLPPPYPAPNATDAPSAAALVVGFGRAVAQASAQGALRVECTPGGCAVPTSFRFLWNTAGTVMSATPSTPWTPGATYVVTVTTSVVDTTGQAIAPDATTCAEVSTCAYRWRFTVPTLAVLTVPLAPLVKVPVAAQWTNVATATVSGCVPGTKAGQSTGTCAGTIGPVTVELWRDAAGDGVVQSGADTPVATLSLTGGLSSFAFVAPLEPTVPNRFTVRVVDAQGVAGPGTAVPTIWQSDAATAVGVLSVLPGPGTLTVTVPYTGDAEKPTGFAPANQKNAAFVEWGDTAVSPAGTFATCGPGNAGRCPMTRTATAFDALISGLTLSAPYSVRVVVTDADGVSGEAVQVSKVAVTGGSTGGLLEGAGISPLSIASRMGQSATVTARMTATAASMQVRVSGPGGVVATSPCLVPTAGVTGPVATWAWNGRDAQNAYVPDAGYLAQVTSYDATGCTGGFQAQLVPVTIANVSGIVLSPDPYTVTVAPGESAVITAKVLNSQGNPVASGGGAQVTWKATGSVTGDVTAWLRPATSEVGTSYADCGVIEGLGQACVRLSVPAAANAAQTIAVTASGASQTIAGAARVVSAATSLNDPPGAPASLSLSAGSINFAWRASNDARVVGYKVYVGTLPGVYDTVLDVGKATKYHWEDTLVNQVYYAVVRSYDALGLVSAPTNEARIVAKSGRLVGTPSAPYATATAYCAARVASVSSGVVAPVATALAVTTATTGGVGAGATAEATVTPLATAIVATPFVATVTPGPTGTAIICADAPVVPVATTKPVVTTPTTMVRSPTVGVGPGTPSRTPEAINPSPSPTVPVVVTTRPTATVIIGPPAHASLVPPPLVSTLGPRESLVLRVFVTDENGVRVPDTSRTVVRWRATLPGDVDVASWLGSVETFVGAQSSGTYGSCSVPAGSGQSCTILLVPKDANMSATLTVVAEVTGSGAAQSGSVRTAVGSTQVIIAPPRGVTLPATATVALQPTIVPVTRTVAVPTVGVRATATTDTGTPLAATPSVAGTVMAGATAVGTPVRTATPTSARVAARQVVSPTVGATVTLSSPTPKPTATPLVAMSATPITPSPTRTAIATATATATPA
jgi:hypothetical protein